MGNQLLFRRKYQEFLGWNRAKSGPFALGRREMDPKVAVEMYLYHR